MGRGRKGGGKGGGAPKGRGARGGGKGKSKKRRRETNDDEEAQPQKARQSQFVASGKAFVASASFQGKLDGYVFKKDGQGVGYYADGWSEQGVHSIRHYLQMMNYA